MVQATYEIDDETAQRRAVAKALREMARTIEEDVDIYRSYMATRNSIPTHLRIEVKRRTGEYIRLTTAVPYDYWEALIYVAEPLS